MKTLQSKVANRLQFALDNNEIPKSAVEALDNELILFYKTCLDLSEYIKDTFEYLHNALQKNILIEGAQGTMLDVDYGTYPYVTSSNCSSGGIGTGLGIPGSKLNNITGIFKAYTTRVGGGPFPTELFNEDGEKLGHIGKEFGATTGRPRRCGWFDLVAAKYSAQVNGLTHIAITKLDILNSFKEIKVCTSYDINGKNTENMSAALNVLDNVKPIYKKFKGWESDISDINTFTDLPIHAQEYIKYLELEIGVPISIISIGPKRHQIIYRNK
jgi:adenylosuccinate synthase